MNIFESTFEKHKKLMLENIVQTRLRIEDEVEQKKRKLLLSGLTIVPLQDGTNKKYFGYDMDGRKLVLIDMGNIKLPFYLSSGEGGKLNVAAGKWYPIFGISKSGWLNKGTEEQINDYYGSSVAKSVSKKLDDVLGDMRTLFSFSHMVAIDKALSIINQDLNPPDQRPTLERPKEYRDMYIANVRNVISKIGGKLLTISGPIKGALTLTYDGGNVLTMNISTSIGRALIKSDDAKYFGREQFHLEKQKDNMWKLIHNKAATNITTIDGKEVTEPTTLVKGMVIALGKTGKFPMKVG